MAKQRVKINPRKLRKVYYVKNRSAAQTARIFGCSPTTVRNYLDKYRFRVKTRREVMAGRSNSKKLKGKGNGLTGDKVYNQQ